MTSRPAGGVDVIRATMRRDLVVALKARSADSASALRTALAAIDNAEAVDTDAATAFHHDGPTAGATVGLGSSEVARRVLTVADVHSVVGAVIAEYLVEADRYVSLHQVEAADGLRRRAEALRPYLD